MLKFHRKVNPKEDLVGLYFSGTEIDKTALQLFTYYQRLSTEKASKQTLLAGSPLLMMIDPTMKHNSLQIKVSLILSLIFLRYTRWCRAT